MYEGERQWLVTLLKNPMTLAYHHPMSLPPFAQAFSMLPPIELAGKKRSLRDEDISDSESVLFTPSPPIY